MKLCPPLLVLLVLALCAERSVQQFWPGAVIGAGIALESAGIGYVAGRASNRHHHHHHGYYGRRRRDAAVVYTQGATEQDPQETAELEAAELDAYFRVIAAEDLLDCGLKLVCELGAGSWDAERLDDLQRGVVAMLSPDASVATIPPAPTRARYMTAYREGAASLGAPEECGRYYPRCPADGHQIMQALRAVSR